MDSRDTPNSTSRMMYLIAHSRSCQTKGTVYWGTFSLRANSLISSCSAPNGHSQPQYTARPQSSTMPATTDQRMNSIGSIRKVSQVKPLIKLFTKVSTLTIDNCPSAYQPKMMRWIRHGFLVYTLIFIGWYALGQLLHVNDRQLPQRVPTDEEQGVNQKAVTDPAHHLRLLYQPVLEEQDEQQHGNAGTQHNQLELFLVPHLHPQGLLFQPLFFGQNRLSTGVILVRQLVFQREYREFAIQRAGLALDRQLQGPRGTGVEVVLLAYDEDGHFRQPRHALKIDIAQAVVVQVAEVEGVAELTDLQPVKDSPANIA